MTENKKVKVEKGQPKKRSFFRQHRYIILFSAIFCITVLLISLLLLIFIPNFRLNGFNDNRVINYKSEYNSEYGDVCFGSFFNCEPASVKIEGEVDTSKLGDYEIKYTFEVGGHSLELTQIVSVIDESAPEINSDLDEVMVCPNGKVPKFKFSIEDNYDGDITDQASISYNDNWVTVESFDSSNNKAFRIFAAKVEDREKPSIKLNGDGKMRIVVGSKYEEQGATAIDNCDEISVVAEGAVDTNKARQYKITYSATDESGNNATIQRIVDVVQSNGTIYLTFDDGPGFYTSGLLDILKKYGVKATFFVTGSGDDSLIKREYDEGHAIGLHTLSHNYGYIYSSMDNFFADLTAVQERVKRVTGYTTYLMRFPGGSSNMVSAKHDGGSHIMSKLVQEVQNRGFVYFDWNVISGDAGGTTSSDKVYENVINNLKYGGSSVVLQHDIKGFSVDAVERIIQFGLDHGFNFSKLDVSSFTAHHGVNN